jgi:hypothetical protein
MKIIYNKGSGHIAFSDEALEVLNIKRLQKGLPVLQCFDDIEHLERTDPLLIEVVEELGDEVNRRHWDCDIKIYDIPDEYSSIYQIKGDGRSEYIVCDRDLLILAQVRSLSAMKISHNECIDKLTEIIRILNTRKLTLE